MLILYDTAHNKICGLTNYSDLYAEQATGSNSSSDSIILDQLHFKYPLEDKKNKLIDYECYIGTEDAEYIVKEINLQTSDSGITWVEYVCDLNIEPLKGTLVDSFVPGSTTAENCTNLVLAGTGWVVGYSDVTKNRSAAMKNSTVWEILLQIASLYNCDITFNTVKKEVNIHQKQGADRGAYFAEQLNLKQLEIQGNSRSYVTRLYPIGKNNLDISSVNNGQKFVSNYQYSPKVISAYWIDNRYTIPQDLMDDAAERLNFLSKPTRSYSADIIDLVKISDKWSLLDFKIGDFITVVSQSTGVKEKLRIVKLDRYFDEPEKSTVELSNKIASLDDIILRVSDAADTVNDVTDSTGDIQGSSVSVANSDGTYASLNAAVAHIGEVITTKVDTTQLDAVNANIKSLQADKADIAYLQANYLTADSVKAAYATIDNLQSNYAHIADGIIDNAKIDEANVNNLSAKYATITSFNAVTGDINTIKSNSATIINLLSDSAGINSLQAENVTANYAALMHGTIGDAQVTKLTAAALTSGTVDTAKVTIAGADSRLKISGNRLQVFANDSNGNLYERISLGDVNNNGTVYGIRIRGSDGSTELFDENGLTKEGITSGYNKADDGSLSAAKLDKESIVTQINGATSTIKGSKVYLDQQAQTLDAAFTNISTTVNNQGKTIDTHTTEISQTASAIGLNLTDYSLKTDGLLQSLKSTQTFITEHQGQITAAVSQTDINTSANNTLNSAKDYASNAVSGLTFTNVIGCNISGNTITDVASTGWGNSGCSSVETLTNGQYVEYIIGSNSQWIMFGLSHADINQEYTSIDYAFYTDANSTTLGIYEKGNFVTSYGSNSYAIGDTLRIAIENNKINYYHNGTLLYTSTQIPALPLVLDIALRANGSSIGSIKKGTMLSGISTRLATAETKITSDAIISTVTSSTVYQNDLNNKVNTSTYNSYVSQTATTISSKVNSNGVISAINQSAESITISASKINLSGYVTTTNLQAGNVFANKLSTTGSPIYGTIGSWTDSNQNINGFQLYNTTEGKTVFRVANENWTEEGMTINYTVLQGDADGLILSPNSTGNLKDLNSIKPYIALSNSIELASTDGYFGVTPMGLIINQFSSDNSSSSLQQTPTKFSINFTTAAGGNWNYQLAKNTYDADGNYSYQYYILNSASIVDLRWSQNALFIHKPDGSVDVLNNSSSDERLKENIAESTENYLNTINSINIVKYNYIKDKKYIAAGVTAQQLYRVNSNFSKTFEIAKDGTEYYAPDWDRVMPYMIGSIQEEDTKVEELRSKIISLENEIEMLKSQMKAA